MTQLQQHSWNLIHGTPDDADDETVETTDDETKEDPVDFVNGEVLDPETEVETAETDGAIDDITCPDNGPEDDGCIDGLDDASETGTDD
ncbi:unnamed protein product [Ambrosiozyma monospora]|uniref:Unnamed protein product n=1 Tax=Ambrosiozyma monospora TaxID=43982 RepID=A0ACB5TBP7_AMBMO|nr:unnamed protein product [Ambrosiozyma monospora]